MEAGLRDEGSLRSSIPLVAAAFTISFVVVGGGIETVGLLINALVRSEGWSQLTLSFGVSVGALYAWTQSYGPAVGVWCVAMFAALLATLTLPRSLPECAGAVA